jgi:hypothetical protein
MTRVKKCVSPFPAHPDRRDGALRRVEPFLKGELALVAAQQIRKRQVFAAKNVAAVDPGSIDPFDAIFERFDIRRRALRRVMIRFPRKYRDTPPVAPQ